MIHILAGRAPRPALAGVRALADSPAPKGHIVDVRTNGGGDEPSPSSFAGCFIDSAQGLRQERDPRGRGISKVFERAFKPSKDRPKYRGRVGRVERPRWS
jgi:C-terminal processing protease CtpA/Prc